LRSGEIRQGTARLQQLASQPGAEADASRFASLAKLMLADLEAEKLLGMKP